MAKNEIWEVERWLDNGFVLQKKYKFTKKSKFNERKRPAMEEVGDVGYHSTEYEEVFRIKHISDFASVDRDEVKSTVVENMGRDVVDE